MKTERRKKETRRWIEERVSRRNNEPGRCYHYVRVVLVPGSTCLASIVSSFVLAAGLKDNARQWIELFDPSLFSPFFSLLTAIITYVRSVLSFRIQSRKYDF